MADTRTLQILLKLKDGASQQLSKFGSTLQKNKKSFNTMATAGAIGFAAVGLGARKAINSASDLGESINAVNVVFGEASKGILELGEAAAHTVGLSMRDFNSLSVQFSNFALTVAGKGGDVVQTMADLTGRAADFASVMNIDVAQAATLFQSGLAGSTEPLRRYGIDLSAAAVTAHALAEGIGTVGTELSEAEKVQARYSLLMKSTSKTQDDFANTSDSMANAQRIMAAEVENLSAAMGDSLKPIIEGIQASLLPIVTKVGEWIKLNPQLTKTLFMAAGAVSGITLAVGLFGKALIWLNANPIMASISAIAILVTAISVLVGKIRQARGVADEMGESVDSTADDFINAAISAASFEEAGVAAMTGVGSSAKDTKKEMEDVLKVIQDLGKEIGNIEAERNRKFISFREQEAKAVVDQQERIKDLTIELNAELAKANKDKDQNTINSLRDTIKKEEAALRSKNQIVESLGTEITRINNFNRLTEFEQTISLIQKEKLEFIKQSQDKQKATEDEIAMQEVKKNELLKKEKEITVGIKSELDGRDNAVAVSVNSQIGEMNKLIIKVNEVNSAMNSARINVSSGLPTSNIRVMSPQASNNVTVNVTGNNINSDQDLEIVGNRIMDSLRLNTKLSF